MHEYGAPRLGCTAIPATTDSAVDSRCRRSGALAAIRRSITVRTLNRADGRALIVIPARLAPCARPTAVRRLGTPDSSGFWGRATSVARVHDRGGLKSACPRCRLKSAYPGAQRAACVHWEIAERWPKRRSRPTRPASQRTEALHRVRFQTTGVDSRSSRCRYPRQCSAPSPALCAGVDRSRCGVFSASRTTGRPNRRARWPHGPRRASHR
jgi:hypothetical protein